MDLEKEIMPETTTDAGWSPWLCVRAQPRRERIAWHRLSAMEGIEVIFPRARYLRKTPKGKKWFMEALFPGYLFLRHLPDLSSRIITYAEGVSYIVRRGQQFAVVPDEAIREISALCDDGILNITETPLSVGDHIKIIGGIFVGTEAEIVALAPAKERVRVLLELLGRPTVVDLSLDFVDRPAPHPMQSR